MAISVTKEIIQILTINRWVEDLSLSYLRLLILFFSFFEVYASNNDGIRSKVRMMVKIILRRL